MMMIHQFNAHFKAHYGVCIGRSDLENDFKQSPYFIFPHKPIFFSTNNSTLHGSYNYSHAMLYDYFSVDDCHYIKMSFF